MTSIALVLVSVLSGLAASFVAMNIGLPVWSLIVVYPVGGMLGGALVIVAAHMAAPVPRARDWQEDGLALR